jgi:hypothetical protein
MHRRMWRLSMPTSRGSRRVDPARDHPAAYYARTTSGVDGTRNPEETPRGAPSRGKSRKNLGDGSGRGATGYQGETAERSNVVSDLACGDGEPIMRSLSDALDAWRDSLDRRALRRRLLEVLRFLDE